MPLGTDDVDTGAAASLLRFALAGSTSLQG